ncbi:MAG: hypothetical protein OXM55_03155 [Bdellovibrionales bacterium]|nr:hypothetical protein [Bdellovibrionales bacterium]
MFFIKKGPFRIFCFHWKFLFPWEKIKKRPETMSSRKWETNHTDIRKTKIVFLWLCLVFYMQPLSAGLCIKAFRDTYSHYRIDLSTPSHIKKVKRMTSLSNEEIKDAVILDVGSHFTYDFVEYARINLGAKEALAVKTFTERPPGVDYTLYDIPEYRLLRMHPLLEDPLPDAPMKDLILPYLMTPVKIFPFKPSEIKEKLGGTFADITISLSVIGQFNLANIKLWMEQLTKVTKPGGIIIVDFGKHYSKNYLHRLSASDFERVLSQMKNQGLIAGYASQHTNHRITRFIDRRFPHTSTTYRVINAYKSQNLP